MKKMSFLVYCSMVGILVWSGCEDVTSSGYGDSDGDKEAENSGNGTGFMIEVSGSSCRTRRATAVVADDEGEILVGGVNSFQCDDWLDDAFLTRVSARGEVLWDHTIESGHAVRRINGLAPTDDGGVIAVGMDCDSWEESCYSGRSEVTRYDLDGNELWSLRIPQLPVRNNALEYRWADNELTSIIRLSDGMYASAGFQSDSNPETPETAYRRTPHVVVFNADGEILNEALIPVMDDERVGWNSRIDSIAEAENGDLVVVGKYSLEGEDNALAIRVTRQGGIVWRKRVSSASYGDVLALETGDFIVLQNQSLVCLNGEDGSIEWKMSINKDEYIKSATLFPSLSPGFFFVGGRSGAETAIVRKMDTAGNVLWQQRYQSNWTAARVSTVAIDAGVEARDGNIVVAGNTMGELTEKDRRTASLLVIKVDAEGNR